MPRVSVWVKLGAAPPTLIAIALSEKTAVTAAHAEIDTSHRIVS